MVGTKKINRNRNELLVQYKNFKLLFQEIVPFLLKSFLEYPNMKTLYFFQVTVLRNQVDHMKPEYSHLFEEKWATLNNGRY